MGCIRVRGLEHPHHPRAPAPPLSRSENLKKTCRSVDVYCRNPRLLMIFAEIQLNIASELPPNFTVLV